MTSLRSDTGPTTPMPSLLGPPHPEAPYTTGPPSPVTSTAQEPHQHLLRDLSPSLPQLLPARTPTRQGVAPQAQGPFSPCLPRAFLPQPLHPGWHTPCRAHICSALRCLEASPLSSQSSDSGTQAEPTFCEGSFHSESRNTGTSRKHEETEREMCGLPRRRGSLGREDVTVPSAAPTEHAWGLCTNAAESCFTTCWPSPPSCRTGSRLPRAALCGPGPYLHIPAGSSCTLPPHSPLFPQESPCQVYQEMAQPCGYSTAHSRTL